MGGALGPAGATIAGVAQGVGGYLGARKAADAMESAARLLGQQRDVELGYVGRYSREEDYWNKVAKTTLQRLQPGYETLPERGQLAQAGLAGRSARDAFAAQGVGPLAATSASIEIEARALMDILQATKRQDLALMGASLQNTQQLRNSTLGSMSLANRSTMGAAEMIANAGVARGQGLQSLISKTGSGIGAGMMLGEQQFYDTISGITGGQGGTNPAGAMASSGMSSPGGYAEAGQANMNTGSFTQGMGMSPQNMQSAMSLLGYGGSGLSGGGAAGAGMAMPII